MLYNICTLCGRTVWSDKLVLLACDEVCPTCLEAIDNDLKDLLESRIDNT